jgi:hypothetical protein
LKVIKWVGNIWIHLAVYGFLLFCHFVIFGLLFILPAGTHYNTTMIIQYVYLVVIWAIIVIGAIVDFLSMTKLMLQNEWVKIWKIDVFWFRFEFYVFGTITLFFFILDFVLKLVLTVNYWWVPAITTSLFLVSLWVMQTGFISVVTIYKMIAQRCVKNTDSDFETLQKLLHDAYGHELLLEYAMAEFSAENIAIWDDIQKFKASPSLGQAKAIFLSYLNGADSELEVNVSSQECHRVRTEVYDDIFSPDMFDIVESAVIANLSDTTSRFLLTGAYTQFTNLNPLEAK